MFEYICLECNFDELRIEVIAKRECPCCHVMLEVIEWEGIEG